MKNIVETAIAAGNFKTLVEAVKAAGLVDALSGPGPFTVLHHNTLHLQPSQKAQLKVY